MTEPENAPSSRQGRDDELENIVDELDQRVTDERAAQGLPGNARDRESTPTKGSQDEPPD